MGSSELISQVRERVAKFALEHPNISQIVPVLLLGEEDELLPQRLTSHQQQADITQRFTEKTKGLTTADLTAYFDEHGKSGLIVDSLLQSMEEVIRGE